VAKVIPHLFTKGSYFDIINMAIKPNGVSQTTKKHLGTVYSVPFCLVL
jgi:hypothetical protein